MTLVSYSIGVGVALDAATKLAEAGIDAEVVDLRTLRPLDRVTVLASLKKTNRMVVVEEGWPTCSISSEIIAIAMEDGFDDLDAPVLRVTNEDVPLPYAANLEKLALIKVEDVVSGGEEGLLPVKVAPTDFWLVAYRDSALSSCYGRICVRFCQLAGGYRIIMCGSRSLSDQ